MTSTQSSIPLRRLGTALRLAAVAAIAAFAAASDCESSAPPPEAPVGFTLQVTSPVPIQFTPGTSTNVTVLISRTTGVTAPIDITASVGDANSGVTAAVITIASGETTGVITFVATASAPIGQVIPTFVGRATGYKSVVIYADGAVSSPGTFFINDLTIGLGDIVIGQTSTIPILLTRNQYTQPVTLSVPTDANFNVTFVQPGTGSTGSMSVTPTTATPGDYQFNITATGAAAAAQHVSVLMGVHLPTFKITPNPTTIALDPGATTNIVVTGVRDPGDIGDIVLSMTSSLPGITAPPVTITGSQATVQVSAATGLEAGNYSLSIHATQVGHAAQGVSVPVKINGGYSLTMQVAPLDVVTGTSQPDVVVIARTNFTGAIGIAGISDAGITVTGVAPTSGGQATISVNVPNTVTIGSTHIVTLTGTSTLPSVVTTFAIVVKPFTSNTSWTFCPTTGLPVWVAMQDGSGPWTAVTGANNVYAFTITGATGGIAYVTQPGTTDVHVFYGTRAELQAQGAGLCSAPGALKTINGSVSNTGTAATAWIGLGSALTAIGRPGTSIFQLTHVPPGTIDLVAATVDGVSPQPNPIKMFLSRGVSIADGGNTGVLDFSGSQAVIPAIKTLTPNIFDQGIGVTYSLQTTNGVQSSYYTNFTNTGPTLKLFGLPNASLLANDLHYIMAQAYNGTGSTTSYRVAGVGVAAIVDMPINFGLALIAPAVSTLGTTPYARIRSVVTVQSDYTKLFEATYQQSNGSNRNVFIQMTGGYAGAASTVNLDIPDFSAVVGWNNTWGPIPGFLTHWIVTSSSWSGSNGIVFPTLTAGTTFNSATRQGDITP